MSLTPARWHQIANVYELAVERQPSEREAFLFEACAGDELLRREVEALLRRDGAETLLDRPIWSTAAALFEHRSAVVAGTMLGPYRVERLLGAGGMGEVFRAIDSRLNRPVAIKILPNDDAPPQTRVRFAREARAIGALAHPHICTLYDVGCQDEIDFLVMEYLEGETLAARLTKGRLPLEQALTHAFEIASALDHAHSQEVVHRDLKPANVMLTASGAKLLDFGLAKFRPVASRPSQELEAAPAGHVPETSSDREQTETSDVDDAQATRGGAIMGTIRYMAPEQIQGAAVDARSDLFAFGAVLFEMITGTRAFDGDSASSIRAAVIGHDPPALSTLEPLVPHALDDLLRRCLAKNPRDRWQTSSDVLRALKEVSESITRPGSEATPSADAAGSRRAWRWVAGLVLIAVLAAGIWVMTGGLQPASVDALSHPIRSLAILPLENLAPGSEQEYLADSLTDQLIAGLATVRGLRVISRTSVMHYKTVQKPVPAIARELNVDAIVEGTVVEIGGRVRIAPKLISGASGEVLWTERFERAVRDVAALQSDVARSITRKIGVPLTNEEPARSAATSVDPAVHRQVLLARHHAARGTEEGLRKAVDFFKGAIAADRTYAAAHAGLAEAYTELTGFYMDPRQAMPEAKDAARTAIQLDETLADAHAALGYAHLVFDWDGPAAERALLRALELNPTLAAARLNYAAYLTTQARHDDAVREIRRAVELDPLSIRTHTFGALLLMFTRRHDEALELARRGLEFEPNSGLTIAVQGVAYAEQGRFDEAVERLNRAAQVDGSLTVLALQAHVLAAADRKDEAVKVLRTVEQAATTRYFCPYEIATVYVSLGDFDTATALFRKGTKERADCMAWLGVEPWIDAFRADPRYRGLLHGVGLAPRGR